MIGTNGQKLEFVELNASDLADNVLEKFDCGNEDITEYLKKYAKEDSITGKGVTYILTDQERKDIYAYATIKTHSLYYLDNSDRHHMIGEKEKEPLLVAIPAVEIKMFAISRKLRGQTAYLLDPKGNNNYSNIFFRLLLEKLYYMSMDTIGFQMIFLRANTEGEALYRKNRFVDCEEYLDTYDEKAEECRPLAITLSDLEDVIFT